MPTPVSAYGTAFGAAGMSASMVNTCLSFASDGAQNAGMCTKPLDLRIPQGRSDALFPAVDRRP